MHVVGNMFFLWAFGIVVEGKLGWWKFLLVYLSIGIFGGFLTQALMMGYQPSELLVLLQQAKRGAGGASLVIFGLMAIAMIWAPRNEVHCVWTGWYRAGTIELEYLHFGGLYLVLQLFFVFVKAKAFGVSSELLHLIGAVLGAICGIVLLKRGWVDCEGWDLFSIIDGKCAAVKNVGSWQDIYVIPRVRQREYEATLTERSFGSDEPVMQSKKKKKAKRLPKLVELESLDEPFREGNE